MWINGLERKLVGDRALRFSRKPKIAANMGAASIAEPISVAKSLNFNSRGRGPGLAFWRFNAGPARAHHLEFSHRQTKPAADELVTAVLTLPFSIQRCPSR